MAARTYSVSPRRKPRSVGPKPMENFSTLTPIPFGQEKVTEFVEKDDEPQAERDLQDIPDRCQDLQRLTSCRAQASTTQSSSSVGLGLNVW